MSTFPDLTTAFTPPPPCTNWYVSGCTDTENCYAEAFPTGTGICGGDGGTDAMTSYACYPKATLSTAQFANGEAIHTLEVATYSPGLYCPLGMTTASSVPLLDGVFCCPSGLRLQGGLEGVTCARTQTKGTFIVSGDCTPTTVPAPEGSLTTTISIYAMAVFLGGQKLLSSPTSATSFLTRSSSLLMTPTPSMSTGADPSDDKGSSTNGEIGKDVGISLGLALLVALGAFWCIRRYRKKRAEEMQGCGGHTHRRIIRDSAAGEGWLELAGSAPRQPHAAAELDQPVTMAELEAPGEGNGAGIFVHKPELPDTYPSTKRSGVRVYVKEKGELGSSTLGHGVPRAASNTQERNQSQRASTT